MDHSTGSRDQIYLGVAHKRQNEPGERLMLWNSADLRKRRLRHLGAALSIVAALTTAPAPAFAQQKTPLRVAYIR
jgi:hypothetical protein